MRVKILKSQDGPGFGEIIEGTSRIFPPSIGNMLVKRNLAEEIKPKKEDKSDGTK